MSVLLTTLIAGFGRRLAYWGAFIVALGIAVWTLLRQGRRAAETDLAIRRAEARVRALQSSKDIRHEVQNADRADLKRRANRWMRD